MFTILINITLKFYANTSQSIDSGEELYGIIKMHGQSVKKKDSELHFLLFSDILSVVNSKNCIGG